MYIFYKCPAELLRAAPMAFLRLSRSAGRGKNRGCQGNKCLVFMGKTYYNTFRNLMKEREAMALKIGVISDTHGVLRPDVLEILSTCDHILHAGDLDRLEVLEELRDIAPDRKSVV